jgi:hypothetical protein
VSWLIRAGLRRGWQRGVVEGNRAWLAVGGLAVLAHLARRYGGRKTDVVFLEKLRPGETFVITDEGRR